MGYTFVDLYLEKIEVTTGSHKSDVRWTYDGLLFVVDVCSIFKNKGAVTLTKEYCVKYSA